MTVVVAPSRLLRLLAAGFGASLLAAALAAGSLAHVPSSPRFTAGPVVAAALLFAGLCLLHAALRPAMVHRIDISGPGRIRLTVQQDLRPDAPGGVPVTLLPGSTLWPRFMLLRFGPSETSGDGGAAGGTAGGAGRAVERVASGLRARRCVVVFPDSVASDAFRALSVALGAVAGQGAVQAGEREIL